MGGIRAIANPTKGFPLEFLLLSDRNTGHHGPQNLSGFFAMNLLRYLPRTTRGVITALNRGRAELNVRVNRITPLGRAVGTLLERTRTLC